MVLPDVDGRPWDFRAETEGRIALLFFGYTYCPDVCPIHMATLAAALGELGPERRGAVDVVFVTVDPERDTPERLRSWLSTFDPMFVGLRGTPEEIEEALAFFRYPPPEHSDEGAVYTVGHPALVYAYTPDGLTHVMYPPETTRAAWLRDLNLLLSYPWDEAPGSRAPGSVDSAGAGASPPAAEPGASTPEPLGRAASLVVLDGWVPVPAGQGPAAVYLTLHNAGATADTLLGLSSSTADEVSLHETVVEGGMARMHPVGPLVLLPGDTLRLRPGGLHGMLMSPRTGALARGGRLSVTIEMAVAGPLRVDLPVRRHEDAPGG